MGSITVFLSRQLAASAAIRPFVVNVTAEKESAAIFDAWAGNLPFAVDHCAQLLRGLDEAIHGYYLGLEMSFLELSRHSTGVARNVDHFSVEASRTGQ